MSSWVNYVPWIIAVIAVVGIIWRAAKWTERVDSKLDAHGKDIGSLKDTLNSFMGEIRADVRRIFERLPPPNPIASTSPIRLTEMGESISEKLGADVIAEHHAPILRERISGMSRYEIQEECFKYMDKEFEPDEEVNALIMESAYDHGIDRSQVLRVIAIKLRDQLLDDRGA